MSRHNKMPPVPSANRSHKGTGDDTQVNKDAPRNKGEVNTAEQGDIANVKQNMTNAGFFKGRSNVERPTLSGREFSVLDMTGGNALFRANAFVSWGSLFDPLIPI